MENTLETPPQNAPSMGSRSKFLIAFASVSILLIASSGSYFLGQQHVTVRDVSMTDVVATPTATPTALPSTTTEVRPGDVPTDTNVVYTDTDVPFTFYYPKSWTLKKTYGKGISKLAPTDVLSGVQVDGNVTSTFGVNVIDSKGAKTIAEWWKTGSHSGSAVSEPNFWFRGVEAIKISYTPGGNPPSRVGDQIYFLWKGKVYFISMQYNPYDMDLDLVGIYNTFALPQ
jgi:hypothetical protein